MDKGTPFWLSSVAPREEAIRVLTTYHMFRANTSFGKLVYCGSDEYPQGSDGAPKECNTALTAVKIPEQASRLGVGPATKSRPSEVL
jgi:hypothetical protein